MLHPRDNFELSPVMEFPVRVHARPDQDLRAGDRLRTARLARNLTLEELGQSLRVRADFLDALENMDMKLLPGRAYAMAYLRSYAGALGLDAREMTEQFERESALTREDALPQLRDPKTRPNPHRPWMAALSVIGALTLFIGWRVLISSPAQTANGDGSGDVTAAVIADDRPPLSEFSTIAPGQSVVEIYALAPEWIEVRGPDGTIFLSRQLKAGERYVPDIGAGWTLHARDGSAFEIYVDGASIGVLGKAGTPVIGRAVDGLALKTLALKTLTDR